MKIFALITASLLILPLAGAQGMGDAVRADARAGGVDAQKAINFQKDVLDKMGVDQHLGDYVPKDIPFVDQHGNNIKFGDLLGKRPIVIMPMFFECKGICGVEADSLVKAAIEMDDLNAGRDYDIVMLSINPKETSEVTNPRWKSTVKLYNLKGTRPEAESGIHFLTGSLENIRRMTDALGFRWVYNPQTDQINHPAGLMVLSSEGQITSYMIDKEFPRKFLANLITKAQKNEISEKAKPILFGCIMVDPVTGARSLVIENVIRLFAAVFAIGVAIWIAGMSLANKRNKLKLAKGGLA